MPTHQFIRIGIALAMGAVTTSFVAAEQAASLATLGCASDRTPEVVFDVTSFQKHVRVAISGWHWAFLLQGAQQAPLPPQMVVICEAKACRLVGGAIRLISPASANPGATLAGYLYVNDPEGPTVAPFQARVARPDQPHRCG